MGVKERREREKQATREAILAEARRLVRAQGWSGLTIRRVAEAIEYSPSIVYEYFPSKEAMLQELMEQGFAELTAAMRHAAATEGDQRERARRIGAAYLAFAHASPDLYQVMHGLEGARVDGAARMQAAQPVCDVAMAALVDWAAAHGRSLADPLGTTEALWSLLHGFASLALAGHLGDHHHVQALLDQSLLAMLDGWQDR
ncbi:TetR/AcrR family transcriptional regulator [Chloroflexia bacterium SDU3-3]|nr:TetR/AcrR family transcriptional regulator [Chloroflexia bacterium SDU3-3]